jgi:hypothetical protein
MAATALVQHCGEAGTLYVAGFRGDLGELAELKIRYVESEEAVAKSEPLSQERRGVRISFYPSGVAGNEKVAFRMFTVRGDGTSWKDGSLLMCRVVRIGREVRLRPVSVIVS